MPKRQIASFLIAIVLVSSALLLVACAPTPSRVQTYAGPARPAEEVALLQETSMWNRGFPSGTQHETTVIEIDGQVIHANWPDELQVLAGAHKVRFQYERLRGQGSPGGWAGVLTDILSSGYYSTRTEHPELEFEARAGGHYAAFGFTDSVDSRLYFWLIDVDTCTLVAGEPPPLGALPCKRIDALHSGTVRQYSQPSP
jgi:hypothetical protein